MGINGNDVGVGGGGSPGAQMSSHLMVMTGQYSGKQSSDQKSSKPFSGRFEPEDDGAENLWRSHVVLLVILYICLVLLVSIQEFYLSIWTHTDQTEFPPFCLKWRGHSVASCLRLQRSRHALATPCLFPVSPRVTDLHRLELCQTLKPFYNPLLPIHTAAGVCAAPEHNGCFSVCKVFFLQPVWQGCRDPWGMRWNSGVTQAEPSKSTVNVRRSQVHNPLFLLLMVEVKLETQGVVMSPDVLILPLLAFHTCWLSGKQRALLSLG